MKVLQVNYSRELGQDDAPQMDALLQAAAQIAELPGLLWKIWLYDDAGKAAGSLYLFDSEESARAWGDGPMEAALGCLPGVSDITKRYFDVDSRLSEITRGPVSAQEGGAGLS